MKLPAHRLSPPARVVVAVAGVVLITASLITALLLMHRARVPPAVEVPRSALDLVDGRLCLRSSHQAFTGILLEHFPDGRVQSRSAVSNGLLEGWSEGFHTNGVKQIAEHFRSGVSDGLRTKWHANGAKLSEAPVVNGQIEGTFRRFFEHGALAEEIEMSGGNPRGLSRAYYPSGYLKAEAEMRDGRVVTQTFWQDGETRVRVAAR
jgi:antitoxin component YwqK of YwqJK toxin-antitoxin module